MTVLRFVGHLAASVFLGLTFGFVALATGEYDPPWALGCAAFCAYWAVFAMVRAAGPGGDDGST